MNDEEMIVLSIPKEWEDTYIKLLTVISQSGEAILNDCSYGCKGDGSIMFNCWNIFQAACAAYALGNIKRANLYINYVNKQIVNKFGEVNFKTKEDEECFDKYEERDNRYDDDPQYRSRNPYDDEERYHEREEYGHRERGRYGRY